MKDKEDNKPKLQLCKTGMQCMHIVGVRSRRLLLDLHGLGKKVNETTRARNIASDTSLIIFRFAIPAQSPPTDSNRLTPTDSDGSLQKLRNAAMQ